MAADGETDQAVVVASPSARARRRLARTLHTAWWSVSLLGLILLIGTRWLRYTSWSAAPALDRILGAMMVVDGQAFLWLWAYSRLKLHIVLLAVVVLVVALHRRLFDRLVSRENGAWRLRPVTVSLVLGAMLWLHYLFDINPTVAAVCGTSLVLAWLGGRLRVTRAFHPSVLPAVWVVFFVCCLLAAGDIVDRLTILVWAGVLLLTHRLLGSRFGTADLSLLRVGAVIPMNVLASVLPLFIALHGGTHLGDGLAYSFCEVPNRGTVYAAVPVCDSVRRDYDDCRGSKVVEYDLRSMRPLAAHDFFSPAFYGRLEQLVCLDNEVQVAVQGSVYQSRPLVLSVLSFPVASPDSFNPVFVAGGLGATMAYDKEHDAIFYSSEFSNHVVRYDRGTRRFDDTASQDLFRRWFEPLTLQANSGSYCLQTNSIDPGRNRIYLADWMQGRYAYAVDLTTLRVVARYDVGGGGALGITVDPERGRLFVSSLWGLEVFDLATDTLIARKRTGLGNRPVIVDAARNRLYVGSTVEGKIRILDRDTLDVIGQIPVGIGSRYPHLSRDGKYLFGSSVSAHHYWDADSLARH